MDINRLNEFIVLADCLNYSKAANLLYLTQPVLSRHIHDLEKTLGAKLFIRDTHNVELTEIGRISAEELKKVVDTYNESMLKIRQATDYINGNLKIGFLGPAVLPFINQFADIFSKDHPKTHIEYEAMDLDPIIQAINSNQIDLAFVTHIGKDSFKDLDSYHLYDDTLCAVVPENTPVSDLESITLEEISSLPFIAYSKTTNPYACSFHEDLFAKYNLPLKVSREVNNVESGLFYVRSGEGYFLLPHRLSFMAGTLPVIPISNPGACISLNLIWKRGNTKPALKVFTREFRKFFDEQEADSAGQKAG